MMKVELNRDAVDAIFRSILIEDYLNLKNDIKRLKETPELQRYQKEDLEANKKYIKAMKTLMEYYIGSEWKHMVREFKQNENSTIAEEL